MHRSRILTLSVLLALTSALPLAAQATLPTSASGALMPPPTADSLRGIELRGIRLAQHVFVARAATQKVRERQPADGSVEQYVLRLGADAAWTATFGRLNAAADTFFVAYEVRQHSEDPYQFDVTELPTPRGDTGFAPSAARAIKSAFAEFGPLPCPYDVAVLERPDGGLWVYLFPAQIRQGVYPLGRDVRYHFSPDGRQMLAKRRMHNDILEYGSQPARAEALAASMHTAVLDNIPEDTDVFHVLVRRPQVPEYVITDEFLYTIHPTGEIRLVGRTSEVLGRERRP